MFYPSALQYFSALQRLSFHWRQRRDVIGFCVLALFCSGGTLIPTDALAGNQTQYIVDGLALGDPVAPKSATYREYKCHPSEQFDSFIWCQRVRTEQSNSVMSRPPTPSSTRRLARLHIYRDTSNPRSSGRGHRSGDRAPFATLRLQPAHFEIAAATESQKGGDRLLGRRQADASRFSQPRPARRRSKRHEGNAL